MNIEAVIIILAVISILWAVWSLKRLLKNPHVKYVKKQLEKGRVIYHAKSSTMNHR